jgi:ACR3 family arsenite transporter
VFLCIVAGIALGQMLPAPFQALGRMEVARVNLPVGLLIWVMIIPMLVKVDFGALHQVRQPCARHRRDAVRQLAGEAHLDGASSAGCSSARSSPRYLPAEQIDSYIAGLILLAAAPCTAMVFVWSRLSNGDPLFTLSQVAVNDTIMIFAFAPIVGLLLGISAITVPWDTLVTSVVLYIVIPLALAQLWRKRAAEKGAGALRRNVMATLGPWSISPRCSPRWCCCSPSRARPSCDQPLDHRPAGGADPHPGVLQFCAGLLAQSRQWASSTASPAPRR